VEPVSLTLGAIVAASVAKAYERIAERAVDEGESAVRRIATWLRTVFADEGDESASRTLELVEHAGRGPAGERALAAVLDERAAADADFQVQLATLARCLVTELYAINGAALNAGPAAEQPAGRKRLRFGLPPSTVHFAGRSREMGALDRGWSVTERGVPTQAITGLGGVGKSELAARYVHERDDRYDVVAWIRCEEGGVADLAALAEQLGEPVANASLERRAEMAVCWLAGCESRWLLVLDNVASAAAFRDCCPGTGNGHVLVTTRDRTWIRRLASELKLGVLDEETAVQYLVQSAGRPDERADARPVARALGCLPLALSHAGAYCAIATRFADYLVLLQELPAETLFGEEPEASYQQTVASTWRTSMQAAQQRSSLAPVALAMAAHMASDAIPRSLFHELIDPGLPSERWRLAKAFDALHGYSLAEIDDAFVRVHALVQKTVRDETLDTTAAARALAALQGAFPDDPSLPEHWDACERLVPHVLAIATHLRPSGDQIAAVLGLLDDAWRYLVDAGQRKRANATAELIAERALSLCGERSAESLRARTQEATAVQLAGNTRLALKLSRRVLADCESGCGDRDPITLAARAQLAFSCQWARRIREAIALGEDVLAGRSASLGPEHDDTLSSRVQLAWSYLLSGRFEDAIAVIEPALAVHDRRLGPDHPTTIFDRATVAVSLRDSGMLGDAISSFKAIAADRTRLIGPKHPDTLWTLANLAKSYELHGDAPGSIAILESSAPGQPGVVLLTERVLGPRHPDALCARAYLASAYWATGRIDEARERIQPVLADLDRIVGLEQAETTGVAADLTALVARLA